MKRSDFSFYALKDDFIETEKPLVLSIRFRMITPTLTKSMALFGCQSLKRLLPNLNPTMMRTACSVKKKSNQA